MRLINKYIAITLFLLISLSFSSCRERGGSIEILSNVSIQVILPEGYDQDEDAGLTVVMRGARTSYSSTTDEAGVAIFEDVLPDYYTISASKSISPSLILSGQRINYEILSSEQSNVEIDLNEVIKTSFVVSKIYASGVKDDANKNYTADVYIEFYNNSDEDVLLDSTYYFAISESESTPAYPAKDSVDYFFARQVFRFIKDGTVKIVPPGESILVSNSAVDHTQNASKSINLTMSDFEAKDLNGKVQNNPTVPALEQIFTTFASITNMNMVRAGENGIVLFSTNDNVRDWPSYNVPGKPTSSNFYIRIPNSTILDGIEVLKSNVTPTDVLNRKRMSSKVDQGYASISNTSGYNGEVISRILSIDEDGKVTLTDTNNSSNDSFVSDQVKPKLYNY
ncbi:MAG: DUF4876 domain-containing protein [Bacteroidales bacterium]